MSRRRIKKRDRSSPGQHGVFLTSDRDPTPVPAGLSGWPIVKCWVPMADAWRATGCGGVCVVREQPDHKWCYACFGILAHEDGLGTMLNKGDVSPAAFDEEYDRFKKVIPPIAPGPIELASAFVWGSWVHSTKRRGPFPPESVKWNAAMVPKPPGRERDWEQRFIGGLVSPELRQVIRGLPRSDNLPEGKELAVFTEMLFEAADVRKVADGLRRRRPEFVVDTEDEEQICFAWTRKRPPDNIIRLFARKYQVIGSVSITNANQVVAECSTLSFAARLCAILKDMFGDDLRLMTTRYDNPFTAFREFDES